MSAASQTADYDPSKDGLIRLTTHIAEKGLQTGAFLVACTAHVVTFCTISANLLLMHV
jgi:hypothetical protein